ncbi:MAG: rubrerythrin family protein, partial [Oscillospiraceae bacterium]|nr:rubrerythrin family protein [Oscillospiraceae bacterium]
GIMYLITVVLLVAPYLLMPVDSFVAALVVMMITVALIILAFNYYISVAKSLNFKERFLEMLVISGSVAVLSFVVGLVVKAWLGIDI